MDDELISCNDIKVKTVNGKVTLTGKVPNAEVRDRAVSLSNNTIGVVNVTSNIEIDGSVASSSVKNLGSDSAITTMIKLKYLEDTELDGLDLHVTTINGEVSIGGVVNNNALKERAISIAKYTNGVKKVTSHIVVK